MRVETVNSAAKPARGPPSLRCQGMARALTDEERKATANLKRLWNDAKRARKFTEADAAQVMGWSPANVNHYLNGRQPLSPKAIFRFAQFLDIDPGSIHPDYADFFAGGLSRETLQFARAFERLPKDLRSYVQQLVLRYTGLSDEALDLAKAWQRLPDKAREYFQQAIAGHPGSE